MRRMACRVCVSAILGTLVSVQALATGIATVTDVVNEGYRQPPGDDERPVAPSDELVTNEALRTKKESRISVTFVDGSVLNVESESEVVLSDYLFDPDAATVAGVINLNVGLFHFDSNDIPDDGLVLKTPVATIGIRGTEFLVTVKNEVTIIDILDGKIEVTPLGSGKPITCEGGQSVMVASADSDAECGDFGAFSTAAGPASPETPNRENHDHAAQGHSAGPSGGGGTGGGPGGGDPGGGDPGGGGKSNRSGHGDGSNPGKGGGNGHGNNNGGTNNPGGAKH